MQSRTPSLAIALLACSASAQTALEIGLEPGPEVWSEYAPEWSPDEERLLFSSNRGGDGTHLYTVEVETGEVRRVTEAPGDWTFGRYSHDGSLIACASNRGREDGLWLIETASGHAEQITKGGSGDFERFSWSPDDSQIVFAWNADGQGQQVWVIDLLERVPRKLTSGWAENTAADWSPDGEWIAFMSRRNSSPDLYKIRLDGADLTRLTSDTTLKWWPSWSPDGEHIVYWSGWKFDFNVCRISADGSGTEALTSRQERNWCPAYSPSGKKIAFHSRHDGRQGICVMEADGTNVRKLTNLRQSEFVRVALADGIDHAMSRLAYSRRIHPDAMFVTDPEVRQLVRRLLEGEKLKDAMRLAEWHMEHDADTTYTADLLLETHRAAGRETPVQALEIVNAFREGDPERGWKLYDSSLKRFPGWKPVNPGWLSMLAGESMNRGDLEEARQLLERALRDYPDNPRAREALRELDAASRR